ncbi:plasmid fertility inhibition factor family protein [Serratia marcescens]|uniref:plasmid fertility inhibition factor family protein n=1 Tax=Serratia marcescens TaxID=615 RepID=UPI003D17FC19
MPLATPTCRFILELGLPVPALDFVDGITRTIWLLANGADRLPVHAYNHHDALLLQRVIGRASVSKNVIFPVRRRSLATSSTL